MQVLVDTSIWSLVLRRRRGTQSSADRLLQFELRGLIAAGDIVLIGPIRQEILSGIRGLRRFHQLRAYIRHFRDEPLESEDYELAAECSNRCQSSGLAGSAVDFLICAVALRRGLKLFTTDSDFLRYSAHIALQFYQPRGSTP